MLIGYMRVSTGEQNLDLQRDELESAGCERIYDDVCSDRATERPGLARALEIARTGDALVVWKLDRIGRSLAHVVGLVGDLQKRGIGLKVLTGDVDTTTTTGRLVFGIFATLAEFERDLIHERTMAGLAAARARGRAGGRPRVMTRKKLKAAMAMMSDRDNAARDVAAELGVSLSTLYAYVDAKGNTIYMDAAINQFATEGYDVRPEDVARLSPLDFGQVNMLGRYAFTLSEFVARGELRPLHDPKTTDEL